MLLRAFGPSSGDTKLSRFRETLCSGRTAPRLSPHTGSTPPIPKKGNAVAHFHCQNARVPVVIEARGLTKQYGQTLAVNDLSFDVAAGQVTGFLGPNGAGKSTTLRMVMGLDSPTSGSVTIDGRPYASITRPLFEVGAMLEAKAIHEGRTAYNHLLCMAKSNGIGRRRVDEVLEMVGLTSVAH